MIDAEFAQLSTTNLIEYLERDKVTLSRRHVDIFKKEETSGAWLIANGALELMSVGISSKVEWDIFSKMPVIVPCKLFSPPTLIVI